MFALSRKDRFEVVRFFNEAVYIQLDYREVLRPRINHIKESYDNRKANFSAEHS